MPSMRSYILRDGDPDQKLITWSVTRFRLSTGTLCSLSLAFSALRTLFWTFFTPCKPIWLSQTFKRVDTFLRLDAHRFRPRAVHIMYSPSKLMLNAAQWLPQTYLYTYTHALHASSTLKSALMFVETKTHTHTHTPAWCRTMSGRAPIYGGM